MNDHRGLSACCGLLFSITCSMLLPMSARASGDLCGAEWRLDHGDAECQNVAALKPDNDTRVNMLLLMRRPLARVPGARQQAGLHLGRSAGSSVAESSRRQRPRLRRGLALSQRRLR